MINIVEIPPLRLDDYVRISSAFEIQKIFDIELPQNGLHGIHLHERDVYPYIKDYDLIDSPLNWPRRFNVKNWGFFLAMDGTEPVGGAIVSRGRTGMDIFKKRKDLSMLCDIRVQPQRRGQGIGKLLFHHAAAWSKARGCIHMKIETQNVNVGACHFYAAQGAHLGDIRRFAYHAEPAVAHEIQLIWYFDC